MQVQEKAAIITIFILPKYQINMCMLKGLLQVTNTQVIIT